MNSQNGLYLAPLQNHHSIEENSLEDHHWRCFFCFVLVVGMGKNKLVYTVSKLNSLDLLGGYLFKNQCAYLV